jgi:hypothetical protein
MNASAIEPADSRREKRRARNRIARRIYGAILLALAFVLGWTTHWFHAEKDLSRYPKIQLTYTHCTFDEVRHSKGSTTRQIVFTTANGERYVMEDGVWRRHFTGPILAGMFAGGGTVKAWVHPEYPHVLRGIAGEKIEVPPEWGLTYDQRNMSVGVWVDVFLVVGGLLLIAWK